ncbi:metallophosphoesterase [Paenibacillus sp. YN15]|uniref:metallophosphoesterase family protein n=1 Tax=Paenibacillus sp. YN15 TaxID=1742774 RepID=UPI00215C10D1|nr:metallophosphoesterase [Paenibacillus sp. YN15]
MKLYIAAWQVILAAVLALTSSGMGGEPGAQTETVASAAQGWDTTFINTPVPGAPKLILPPGSPKLERVLPVAAAPGAAAVASAQASSSVQGTEHSSASAWEFSSVQRVELSSAPAVGNQSVFRFAVISDIHVEAWNKESHTKLRKALTDLSQNVPGQALVINGDLGNGLPGDYETLGKLMREIPYPGQVVYTIGNHEFYKAWTDAAGKWNEADFPNGETPEASIGRFLQFTGYDKVYHDSWIEGYHFIFLGSETYRQTDDSFAEDAWLSEKQLQWLEGAMAERAEEGKPIFVFLHQPLPYTVAGSFTDFNSRAVIQHERLKEILSRYPQTVFFSGHSHWELGSPGTLIRDGFTMVNTSSVQSPYDTSDTPIPAEEQKSEGLVVEVSGNKVHIRGRDFTAADWIPAASYTVEP